MDNEIDTNNLELVGKKKRKIDISPVDSTTRKRGTRKSSGKLKIKLSKQFSK